MTVPVSNAARPSAADRGGQGLREETCGSEFLDIPAARDRKETATPAPTVLAEKMSIRRNCPCRRAAFKRVCRSRSVLGRVADSSLRCCGVPGSHGDTASGFVALTAAAAMTAEAPTCTANQTPNGSAKTAGTVAITQDRELGPVPSESSSGSPRSQGSMNEIGDSHARRLLVSTWPGTASSSADPGDDPGTLYPGHLGN